MGGSVNLQGGGQYSMPNIQGYGQNAANIGQSAAGFGSRFGNRGYGPPPQYDGGYGDFGDYGGVSTGGKGFQQQPQYQPAPVMQPYVDQVSQGGKGFQARQTPSQSVAYAPMNIPQMQLAQPSFYYPNIGSQMANLQSNYGMGGLGAMGAFGNYPMMQRPPMQFNMYPALQPSNPLPPPPPPTSTGGKGFNPNRPIYQPPPYNPELNPVRPTTPVMPSNPNTPPVNIREPVPYPMMPTPYEDRQLPRADQRLERQEQYDDFFPPPIDVDGQREDLGQIVSPAVQPEFEAFPFENQTDYSREYYMPAAEPNPTVLPQEPMPAIQPAYEQPAYEDTREYFPERNGDFGMETLD